jgi:hypothetical protein
VDTYHLYSETVFHYKSIETTFYAFVINIPSYNVKACLHYCKQARSRVWQLVDLSGGLFRTHSFPYRIILCRIDYRSRLRSRISTLLTYPRRQVTEMLRHVIYRVSAFATMHSLNLSIPLQPSAQPPKAEYLSGTCRSNLEVSKRA